MQRRKFIQNLSLASAATVLPIGVNAENTGKKKRFRAAFISDIHIKTLDVAEAGMRKVLQTINQSDKKPDFIINGGDSIMDALAVSKEKTKAQWDLFSDPLYGKNWWLQLTGNTKSYYSFTHQNWHFIVLDSTQENNGGYIALLDAEQFNWLGAELESNKDKHICVVSHIPIVSFCSAMFFKDMLPNGDWKLSRALLHTDARMIKDLFRKYPNIRCCLSGHIHLQDEVTYLGIQYFCNGAVSGNWWKGAFQDFAPAYALFDFHQDGAVERTMVEY